MKNTKATKRAIIASVLSLILCCTMLLGTTFAWFTDSASANVNKVQAGNLDVTLEMYVNGEWVNAEGKTLNFVSANGNTNILWEPGCTYETPEFRVVNKGNLALKYQFMITGITGNAKLNEVIDWKYEYVFANGSGVQYPVVNLMSAETKLLPGNQTLGDFEARGYKIVGHMDENAGNEYQGLSIDGISITVIAKQVQEENDSNGNTYDANAVYDTEVVTAAELKAAMEPAYNELTNIYEITLNKNYILRDAWTPYTLWNGNVYEPNFNGTVVINGNGHSIANLSSALLCDNFCSNLTVKDLTIRDSVVGYASVGGSGNGAFVGYMNGYPVTFDNCHLKNVTVNGNGGNLQVGGLIGQMDCAKFTATNCSVLNCTINGDSSAGGLVGMLMTDAGQTKTIAGCTVQNCKINSTDEGDWRIGGLVGTVNGDGVLTLSQPTAAGKSNTLSGNQYAMTNSNTAVNPGHEMYGRTRGTAQIG